MKKSPLCLAITVVVFVFLYLPIAILIVNSFNVSRFGSTWLGFSLKWYQGLLASGEIWEALNNSLAIAAGSTFVATVIGSTGAFALYLYKTTLQKVHHSLVFTPLFVPDLLMGISLLLFAVAVGLPLGLGSIFIAHTTFCVSYVAMVMLAKLQNFDYSMIEAAQDLGANPSTIFHRVLLPLLAPGLIAAALLAFTMSIDDFVITYFVAGEGTNTLPLYIYNTIKMSSTPIINALSTLILLASFLSVWAIKRYTKEELI